MSVKLQALVWAHEMSRPQQSVLLAMADSGHDDGTSIYPSFTYLAWKTSYGVRQVIRIVDGLKKMGAVKRIRRGNSHRRANEYRLDFSVFKAKRPYRKTTSDKMSLLDGQPVSKSHSTSDISAPTSDIAMSHQSSSESLYNHKRRTRAPQSGSLPPPEQEATTARIQEYIQKFPQYRDSPSTLALLSKSTTREVKAELEKFALDRGKAGLLRDVMKRAGQ